MLGWGGEVLGDVVGIPTDLVATRWEPAVW
jgi:hypothetical protein